MYYIPKPISWKPIIKKLNFLTFASLYILKTVNYEYVNINEFKTRVKKYLLLKSTLFILSTPIYHSHFGQKGLHLMGIKIYNKVSDGIKRINSINKLKSGLEFEFFK